MTDQSLTADRELWLAADRRTVLESDAFDRAHLLAVKGSCIPARLVVDLGLERDADGAIVQRGAPAPETHDDDEGSS